MVSSTLLDLAVSVFDSRCSSCARKSSRRPTAPPGNSEPVLTVGNPSYSPEPRGTPQGGSPAEAAPGSRYLGLGGRLDSTNVCTPRLSIVTSISFDHTKQLGETLAAKGDTMGAIEHLKLYLKHNKRGEYAAAALAQRAELARPRHG